MKNNDLYNKLTNMINEELNIILNEETSKYGNLLKPDDFDPIDPQIHVVGFGTMSRNALRKEIVTRLEGALKSAKNAAMNPESAYDIYKTIETI